MKVFFASDIHGSAYYCQKLLSVFAAESSPKKLILLGDLLYHGPRNPMPKDYSPQKTAELLNGFKEHIICVRGNCDADVDQLLLDFPIKAENLLMLLNEHEVFVSHGHVFSPETPPLLHKGDILINGHFHIGEITQKGDYTYINTGSVSMPKNNIHSYILFEDGHFYLKTLDGETINTL